MPCATAEGMTVVDSAGGAPLLLPSFQRPFTWCRLDYPALEARFDGLSEGKTVFINLRERALPLAQGVYRADGAAASSRCCLRIPSRPPMRCLQG